MRKPRCLCCKHCDRTYANQTCNKCINGDHWEAKKSCQDADGNLRCSSCANNTEGTTTT